MLSPNSAAVCRSLMLLALLTVSAGNTAAPLDQQRPVGSTTLRVLFWTLYDSTLFTPSGEYRGLEAGLALQIDYRRNIGRERLIDATRDQWQTLNLYRPDQSEAWLAELRNLWPDIRRGDRLTLLVEDDLAATFFHNGQRLGGIPDPEFSGQFLAIWLAENSSYPQQRNELIGAR